MAHVRVLLFVCMEKGEILHICIVLRVSLPSIFGSHI